MAELAKTSWGDAQNGASLAGACAACHGLDGNATDPSLYPRIAGQSERYIAKQLALFKSDYRNTGLAPLMKPFADMAYPFGTDMLGRDITAGLLYGYVGEYKDRVPLNYKGFSPGVNVALAYQFTPEWAGQVTLGGSYLMFQLNLRLI